MRWPDWTGIYVTGLAHDARYTRICVASVRHFSPQVPIKLLAGGPLESGLKEAAIGENSGYSPGQLDWDSVKLEPLFEPPGERFLAFDSDTGVVGEAPPIL